MLRPYLLAGAAVLLVLICLVLFFLLRPSKPDATRDSESLGELISPGASPPQSPISLSLGDIIVLDPSGNEVSRWNVSICGYNWVALPVSALFGGKEVVFQTDDQEVPLERGNWAFGDPVALWKIETDADWNAPGLAAWRQNMPLFWRSLQPGSPPEQVEIAGSGRSGSLIRLPLGEEIRDPGVFIQEDRIVGWTFGDGIDGGYLWTRSGAVDLNPGIVIGQLVASLSSSREADFNRAFAAKGVRPAQERLEIYARGFLRPRFLAAEDVSSPLQDGNVVAEMHALALALLQEGRAEDVVRILSFQVIMESSEPLLVQDAVLAMVTSKDHNRGIQYLESIKKDYFAARGQSLSGLERFHAQLYKDWLRKIIAEGGYFSAMAAFDAARKAFPDDPEIHLLGVEAAMAEEDWGRAQELLQTREYPPSLKDRALQLENQIKEKSEESEALVVRFNPGESHIPVYADLNSRHRQKFIIDTGADTCTIPESALEPLGIKIDDRTAVRLVEGIGGLGLTYEVTLETVALDGWSVKNVKALVIDLSSYPDCGLLGLNFLNHFRYEIDKDRGILRLKRK